MTSQPSRPASTRTHAVFPWGRVYLNSGGAAERRTPSLLTGAIEGTRTPTPLRVHGPEPCASANSATMASGLRCSGSLPATGSGDLHFYSTDAPHPVKRSSLNGAPPLPQRRRHRNFRVQHFRHRATLLRRFCVLLESRCIGARHLAHYI